MSPTGANELQDSIESGEEADDTFIGWRYDPTSLLGWPDNRRPLLPEDLLHPEEGDLIVQTPRHDQIIRYLMSVLEWRLKGRADVRVINNVGIDFERFDRKFSSPDIAVVEGAKTIDEGDVGKIPLRSESVSPLLVIEVTSRGTRKVDLGDKLQLYHEERVPIYVIVDIAVRRRQSPRLLGYALTEDGYTSINEDARGRIPLGVGNVCLSFGPGGVRNVVCTDAETGLTADEVSELQRQREEEQSAARRALDKEATARKRSENKAAKEAEQRAAAERKALEAERKALAEAERRLALEQELAMLRQQLAERGQTSS